MKTEYWVIVVALLLVTALGGIAELNTIIGQHEEALVKSWQESDRLIANTYWTRMLLRPKPYYHPLRGARISSGTGYRTDPMGGVEENFHKGVDLVAPIGTPVYAILDGTVVCHYLVPGWWWGKEYFGHPEYGAMIIIDHGNDLFSIYGHLSKTEMGIVQEGKRVEAGQKIGELGNTGISTGPHLHFEIVVDPLKYLEEKYDIVI